MFYSLQYLLYLEKQSKTSQIKYNNNITISSLLPIKVLLFPLNIFKYLQLC